MTAAKMKVAYTLFLLSFSVWLFLIGISFFPAITQRSQIQFPNPAVQALFIGSAATSTAGCLLFGAHFLGFGVQPTKQTRTAKAKFIKGKMHAPKEVSLNIGIIAREEQKATIAKKKGKQYCADALRKC